MENTNLLIIPDGDFGIKNKVILLELFSDLKESIAT
jgi:hypothetical protein